MIVQIAIDALKAAKIQGVRNDNITEDLPANVRDEKVTRIVVFEEDSAYTSIGDGVDEAGMYRTQLKIQVGDPSRQRAKAVCLLATQIVQRTFESMRFRDARVHGVEKSDKSIGRWKSDKQEELFLATRTLIVMNQFEP